MINMSEFKYKIIDVIEILEESPNSDWGKVLLKISWNDKPATIDIRTVKLSTLDEDKVLFGKGGTALSDKACQKLAETLFELGYVDRDIIDAYIEQEDSIFKPKKKKKKKLIHIIKKKGK